jgi:hypothetical protein
MNFPGRLMGIEQIAWSPHSSGVTPLNYFLCG